MSGRAKLFLALCAAFAVVALFGLRQFFLQPLRDPAPRRGLELPERPHGASSRPLAEPADLPDPGAQAPVADASSPDPAFHLTLVVHLTGPDGAPVEKGTILVGRQRSPVSGEGGENGRIGEGLVEASHRGEGAYATERLGPGDHVVLATASGCARAYRHVKLPLDAPLEIRLAEGWTVS